MSPDSYSAAHSSTIPLVVFLHLTPPRDKDADATKKVGNLKDEQKKIIWQWHDANVTLTQSQLVDKAKHEFDILKAPVQGTISSILRDRQKFLHVKDVDLKSMQNLVLAVHFFDLAFANWVLQCQTRDALR